MRILADGLAPGQTGLVARLEALVDRFNLSSATAINVMDEEYGAVGDGVADDTAAIAAAMADADLAGGTIIVPPGTFKVSSLGTITKPNVSIEGAGSGVTIFTYTGSGSCLTVQPSPLTVTQMGKLSGFTIQGNANAGAKGLHHIDSGTLMAIDDVVIEDFTGAGAVGHCIENVAYWNERAYGVRHHLNHNTIGMQLIGNGAFNSFAYHRWLDLRVNLGLNQIGIQAKGTALAYNGLWNIICNADADNGILFDFADTASIDGQVFLTGEQTTGTGMTCRRMAAGALWAAHTYKNVFGAVGGSFPQMPDSGTVANIVSPVETDRNGRSLRLWPAAPTAVAAAGAGTAPPDPILTGNDSSATVLTGTGTSPAFGDQVEVTFYEEFPAAPEVTVTAFGRPTALLQPYLAAVSTTSCTIGFANAPAASQAVGTYGVVLAIAG